MISISEILFGFILECKCDDYYYSWNDKKHLFWGQIRLQIYMYQKHYDIYWSHF